MKHLIIGTAGHVDHGKTALVKAMTGIDTDRLKEEKDRGISIELGFASLNLSQGRKAGIVDVPGHERFIKNMLAGAGGFDLVLLVIAADEGVMPQTREHLDIIQLLQVKKGIVVLTKADLVDEEWLEMVREEVKDFLQGTILEDAPIADVSAVTGRGIPELIQLIDQLTMSVQAKTASGPPRLPVDRVFTITGFGTVVTGTLVTGFLKVGDVVEIQPEGLTARIRSLQVHGKKVGTAEAGQRVAVNIAGIEVDQIERGSVVAGSKSVTVTNRLDVRLLLLESAPKPVQNRSRIRFYLGTRETLGRVVLLDREELKPGSVAYAQLHLEEMAVAVKGDHFVIRSYSPMLTIGGGTVIDPLPRRKHRRFRSDVLKALATREKGTPSDLVEQFLKGASQLYTAEDIASGTGLNAEAVFEAVGELAGKGAVKKVEGDGKDYFVHSDIYRQWSHEISKILNSYHTQFPLREGYPKEELRSRKFQSLSSKLYQCLLAQMDQDGLLKTTPRTVALRTFSPDPGGGLAIKIDKIRKIFIQSGFLPPSWTEACRAAGIDETAGQEIVQYLIRTGEIVKVSEDLFFQKNVFQEARDRVVDYLKEKGEITVGELRDILKTSRKYALPLLEFFDQEKITRRVGDKRLPGRAFE